MPDRLTDEEIRAEGRAIATDHRYSDEFLGSWLRFHADVILAEPKINDEIAKETP